MFVRSIRLLNAQEELDFAGCDCGFGHWTDFRCPPATHRVFGTEGGHRAGAICCDRCAKEIKEDLAAREITLPGHKARYRVSGFERRRNIPGGPFLTLAIAGWTREGFNSWLECRDIVTLMRLADLLSERHDYPVNPDRLYGKLGRGCEIGRKGGK